ncbi:hypothetical protein AURDEDRAFT_119322 [Auricularia subglabra TFB-10046 SS5]|nr:hypothetical protein AURDEDRAFT_119322 [Auricularia subglabra TFB-10046 SS5]
MCWAVGSPSDATRGHCRVCKILDNKGPCPHDLQVCTQRHAHPDFDVRHYTNSDFRWTNHCGRHPTDHPAARHQILQGSLPPLSAPPIASHRPQWAKANPAAEPKQNRGWPGCCRAPTTKEWVMVKDPTVATIIARMHDVPIPDPIRHSFDQLQHNGLAAAGAAAAGIPRTAPPAATPAAKAHSTANANGNGSGNGPSTALPPVSPGGKTRTSDEQPPPAFSPPAADAERGPPPRRLSVSGNGSVPSAPTPRRANTAPDNGLARALSHKKSGSLQQQLATLSLAQRGNTQVFSDSDSSSTVRSEFTDYLSDESEAELQRLALERAQLKREEEEFRAARARLAGVDTTPPIEWRSSQPASTGTRPRHGSNGSGGSGGSAKQASPKQTPAAAAYVARPAAQTAPNPAAVPRAASSVIEIQRAIAASNRAAQPQRAPQAPRIRGG